MSVVPGMVEKAAVAKPELLMVATLVSDDFQVAELVRSCSLPSEKIPVAWNCWIMILVEIEIMAKPGVTSIDSSTAGVTISVA